MIRVLLADDEGLIRSAVAALLALEGDLDVVAQAVDGPAAVAAAIAHRPDVALVDLEMPGLDGVQVAAEITRAVPACRVVVLTGRGRPAHLRRALEAGARGFVTKGASGATLAGVLRTVHAGERYVDPGLAADALSAPTCPLSPRELEVLRLASFDLPPAVIAQRAHLAPGTVRNYLLAAQAKLDASTRAEAVRTAERFGWL
ncbi:response regulator transcription factor [Cellulomonas shaoxiangyii]|uniref:Response regulator transcription factor n=1 Tax=Cellulomonas shaoxiangyii TaxID=2566013 RepID=A0A4P7SE00_9CELL|nr:response regulator transcription factor [Cellulomonas shaoxiangyii]QCB92329.1 response regulator transcription factor [Cellulomonas shaoxiangyii]TGY86276.1 response regulator transcription factor [Cellulomonas shaoxiangyii]